MSARVLKFFGIFADIVYDERIVDVSVYDLDIAIDVFDLKGIPVADILYFLRRLTLQKFEQVQPSLN